MHRLLRLKRNNHEKQTPFTIDTNPAKYASEIIIFFTKLDIIAAYNFLHIQRGNK